MQNSRTSQGPQRDSCSFQEPLKDYPAVCFQGSQRDSPVVFNNHLGTVLLFSMTFQGLLASFPAVSRTTKDSSAVFKDYESM